MPPPTGILAVTGSLRLGDKVESSPRGTMLYPGGVGWGGVGKKLAAPVPVIEVHLLS